MSKVKISAFQLESLASIGSWLIDYKPEFRIEPMNHAVIDYVYGTGGGADDRNTMQGQHISCLHPFYNDEINCIVFVNIPGFKGQSPFYIYCRRQLAYIGQQVLIPAGARLIGQYNSQVTQGQTRVFVLWNRLVLPNGVTIHLDSPSSDALGVSGQGANSINHHFWAQFGQAGLLSILGAGASMQGVSPSDEYNSAAMYRASVGQAFQQSASQTLANNTVTGPTLHIYQGTAITVFVAHDLDFSEAQ